jgi:Holliday junction resolvasome RuvABC endonuclease subunit
MVDNIKQFAIMYVLKQTKQRNKMLYQTLEQSLKTKSVVILSSENYNHKGNDRKSLKVRKLRGAKVFTVIQYENSLFSEAV